MTFSAHAMADIKLSNSAPVPPDDDNFERDLQEMLEDGPSLNDVTSNVQGGTPNSVSATFAEQVGPFSAGASPSGMTLMGGASGIYGSGISSTRLTRSYTVPPGMFCCSFIMLLFLVLFSEHLANNQFFLCVSSVTFLKVTLSSQSQTSASRWV